MRISSPLCGYYRHNVDIIDLLPIPYTELYPLKNYLLLDALLMTYVQGIDNTVQHREQATDNETGV